MNLMPPTGSVFAVLRLARRKRELRALYCQLLANFRASADDRIVFHLNHLSEYWSRCAATWNNDQTLSTTELSHNLVLAVLVGTETANGDVLSYCDTEEAIGV